MRSLELDPHPALIELARHHAGLTQSQAAQLIGLEGYRQWGRWERSLEPMPPLLWELFLMKVGLHPHHMPRPGVVVPRSAKAQVQAEDDAELEGRLQLAGHVLQTAMRR